MYSVRIRVVQLQTKTSRDTYAESLMVKQSVFITPGASFALRNIYKSQCRCVKMGKLRYAAIVFRHSNLR